MMIVFMFASDIVVGYLLVLMLRDI